MTLRRCIITAIPRLSVGMAMRCCRGLELQGCQGGWHSYICCQGPAFHGYQGDSSPMLSGMWLSRLSGVREILDCGGRGDAILGC
jgi:hypothetical protein